MNDVERAIVAFIEERTDERFEAMYQAVLSAEFVVPISEEGVKSKGDVHRIPVLCFRNGEGFSEVPAFTRVQRLFDWRPQGSHYVDLVGDKLIDLVFAMPEIDVIEVNPKGVPRGLIPREHFLQMLAMHHGVEVEDFDVERVDPQTAAYIERRVAAGGKRPRQTMIRAMIIVVALTVLACIAVVYFAR